MKKLLTLMIAALWAAAAQAQGTFTFSNRVAAAGLDQPVFDYGNPVSGPNMVAAIFWNGVQLGPTAVFRTGVGAGYWNPGQFPVREVPGRFAGDVVTGFTVWVWDSSKGDSVEAAKATGGKFGRSQEFSITLGGPKTDPLLPADIPGLMSNFRSFEITLPEPSVVVLGALGAALLLFRRRGKSSM